MARLLNERGDDLRLLLRPGADARALEGVDFEESTGDLLDRRAVRRSLRGVDRVFHTAGLATLRADREGELYRVNVEGTRILLEEALRGGVERAVITSTAATFGPAPPGGTADETQIFTAGSLGIPFVNARHEAELEALRLAARGLPVVCVNPTLVLGAGDHRGSSTALVRRFLLGRIPLYTDGAVNVVGVDDVARGHMLADTDGANGERYILGNRNYTLERLFADLARLSGIDPPALKLPAAAAVPAAHLLALAPGREPITVTEATAASRWWTYRSTKARRELGWSASPHEDAVEATVDWYLDREGDAVARARRTQPVRYRLAATGLRVGALAAGAAGSLPARLGLRLP